MNDIEKSLDIVFNPNKAPKKWDAVDQIEGFISTLPEVTGDVQQRATPGLYSRELSIPAGTLFTSVVHRTIHQFVVSKGAATVYNTLTDESVLFEAGDCGITLPGTRRVFYVHEDLKWILFYPTDKITADFYNLTKIEQERIFDEIT